MKHTGELPIIGVNTFISKDGSPYQIPENVSRSTEAEKQQQIENLQMFEKRNAERAAIALAELKRASVENRNIFEQLMEVCKVASLGQISRALYEVGGQYRRNM